MIVMSETPNPPVAETPTPAADEQETKQVPYESHRKLLEEKKLIQKKLKEFEDEKKAAEEKALIAKGNLQEALDLAKKEAEEFKNKLTVYEQQRLEAKKISAVAKGLGGVDDKWLGVISQHIDDVSLDAEGNIDTSSVAKVTETLKKSWPEMLRKPTAGMPNGTPTGGATTISREDWVKLPAKEMSKWKPNQVI
jgi:hypothetical protein